MNTNEVDAEVSRIVEQVNKKLLPLSAFEFGFASGIRTDIKLTPIEADNKYGMSAIQVWKLVETYQVNDDGSLTRQDIK